MKKNVILIVILLSLLSFTNEAFCHDKDIPIFYSMGSEYKYSDVEITDK